MFPTPIEHAPRAWRIGYRIGLPVALLIWLVPILGVAWTSVRSIEDIQVGNYWGLPQHWRLFENYRDIFTQAHIHIYALNSVIISASTVLLSIAVAMPAAYAFAKYRFAGNTILFSLFVAGNFVPFQVLMIPVRDLAIMFGIYNTLWALIVFHVAFQAGFCTLFLRNFISQLPDELIDAARIEGVSEGRIFIYIIVPLVRPALAALAVLTFTVVWNDFFWSVVLVQSEEVKPITTALQSLKGMWTSSWNLIAAGAILAALPPVFLFITLQRHFIAGLTLGATKG